MTDYNPSIVALLHELVDRAKGRLPAPEPCLHRIPVDVYTSADHFDREQRCIFSKLPLLVGHASQLNEPGDALVHDHTGLPLVTVRGKDDQLRSFLNVCRHRGMRLVQEPGLHQLRSLVCPYHQWTYDLHGRLKNVPRNEQDFSDLNLDELGLVSLPTECRHGMIWVQLTPNGTMDLDEHLAGLGQDFEDFGLGNSVVYKSNSRELRCNWKLIHDAFLDGYHVVRLHKKSVGPFFPDSLAAADSHGSHCRSAVGRNEALDASDDPATWNPRVLSTFSYTLFPNAIIIMHPDYTSIVMLFPLAADRTVFSHLMLLEQWPDSEKARAHFDRSFEMIDQGVFQAEDIFVSEGTQKGLHSGANRELLLGASELSIKRFHDAVEEKISQLRTR